MSSIKKPLLQGDAGTGAASRVFCNLAEASISFYDKLSNCLGFPLLSLASGRAAIRAELGMKRWKFAAYTQQQL